MTIAVSTALLLGVPLWAMSGGAHIKGGGIDCPAPYSWIGVNTGQWLINKISGFSYYPLSMIAPKACWAQAAIADNEIEETALADIAQNLQMEGRADLSVSLLEQYRQKHPSPDIDLHLAFFYDQGQGIKADEAKARHLYCRYYARIFPPVLSDGKACISAYNKFKKYSKTQLETAQIEWFQGLCVQSPEALYKLAASYMDDKNPQRDADIAVFLLLPLKNCPVCNAQALLEKAKKESSVFNE